MGAQGRGTGTESMFFGALMMKDQDPPGGLPLNEALMKLVRPSLRTKFERAQAIAARLSPLALHDGGFRDEMHNIFREFFDRLGSGEIVAFGYRNTIEEGEPRQEIPSENWKYLHLKKGWKTSFEGGGYIWWWTLFYRKRVVEKWRVTREILEGEKKTLGRPSEKDNIEWAYDRLVGDKKIDFSPGRGRQKVVIKQVRKKVMDMVPAHSGRGVGDEAIRKLIYEKFQAGQAAYIKTHEL